MNSKLLYNSFYEDASKYPQKVQNILNQQLEKMHFSIPDTQDFIDGVGNTYVGYNIHINGLYHCTVRYKQLHNLHEQLTRDLDVSLPTFPPKKLFPLTINQQEERRLSLEKYIQSIGQNPAINNSELLNGFLINAQQESIGSPSHNESFDIYLMNGRKLTLNVSTGENSVRVLKKVCEHILLPDQYHSYFALFIIIEDEDNSINILRKLQEFESPFITYKIMSGTGIKVVLGRGYWDIGYDCELMNNPVALDLLYIQAVAEVNRKWILVPEELEEHLKSLHGVKGKEEYLEVVQTFKYYGYVQFAPCYCDYPQLNSRVLVAIGRNELNLRIITVDGEQHEAVFKVSRMRCWRITTIHNGVEKCDDSSDYSLELSFEYLIAKDQLQWITISSEQAIVMSVCLQAMIDELLLKTVGGNKNQRLTGKSWTYITRDGHSQITIGSPSAENINMLRRTDATDISSKSSPIIKKLTDRFLVSKAKKQNDTKSNCSIQQKLVRGCDTMENNAFHMIGDDDL